MTPSEALFHQIAAELPNAVPGKMFGSLCIKAANGKAAVFFKNDLIVFKLPPQAEQEALSLDGTGVFEPGGRPMRGWTQVPYAYADRWPQWARQAMAFVGGGEY